MLRDGPGPPVTRAPSTPAWGGTQGQHGECQQGPPGDPPCSPRATLGVTSYSCHLRATSALPSSAPSLVPCYFGRCQGPVPHPSCRGDSVPQLGTGLAEALGWVWGAGAGVPQDRVGPGDGDGSVLTQRGLDFAVAAVVPRGQICVPTGAAGPSTSGAGGAEGWQPQGPGQEGPSGCWCPWSGLAGDRACREGCCHFWKLLWRQKRKMKALKIRKMFRHGMKSCPSS